ncbi:uncharacterized protein MONOS_18268 [Monocercomonoides exilis]|uniref:uncharacterized protein n=1 Tax=Monocercomonoides exilis TaxID=2049356 RepID=UPI00355A770C|nr:hypothetical protein MONOS_18268 [Monocercomonoides exilis]
MLFDYRLSKDLARIVVPCLLKAVLKKEENEDAQKEVEMALLALSNIWQAAKVPQELYLIEILEIIKYHQEHHNLTRFAYQSAWIFFVNRLSASKKREIEIANEMHFGSEAIRELEELALCVNVKKNEKVPKDCEDGRVILRWLDVYEAFGYCSKEFKEKESQNFMKCIVDLLKEAKGCEKGIYGKIVDSFMNLIKSDEILFSEVVMTEAFEVILEMMHTPTLDDELTADCLCIFISLIVRFPIYL